MERAEEQKERKGKSDEIEGKENREFDESTHSYREEKFRKHGIDPYTGEWV